MTRSITRAGFLRAVKLCAAMLVIAGCGSGGGDDGGGGGGGGTVGGGTTGGGAGGAGGGNPNLEATFQSIQDNIFTPICTACHVGAGAPQGLRLDEANSFALLVGVASTEVPGTLRVAPGNPSASYLIQKLEGTAAVGARMPLNGTPLPAADIAMIRQWITDGAQPPAAPPATAPIRVTSVTPAPSSTVATLPTSIMVAFDREPNASTVNTATFLVDRSGGDGSFAEGNEVPVTAASISVPAANTSSAVFDLTGVASVEDTYRVRLLGSGAAGIIDLDSNALDGEFSGTLPSGDDTAGGDFSATFLVSATLPTLASIQETVFGPKCSGCHTGPTSNALPGGMDLSSAAASHASLVGVMSLESPTLQRVKAGDPDNSYVVHKVEGTATSGQRMPLGGPPLGPVTIAALRKWISDGAAQ
ncbi:MAG TPA: Ig-like domain-containing protein [Gammaproteobacteria bacterium]|nr:Ig-like domain-containing protein [Gammaproteobacteria bacterium]